MLLLEFFGVMLLLLDELIDNFDLEFVEVLELVFVCFEGMVFVVMYDWWFV